MIQTTTSHDGTRIAYEQTGRGPAVILTLGAFNDRSAGVALGKALAPHFTVLNYDRRGRGASGDAAQSAVMREIEDIEALITVAGGSANVFGYSSGALLAVRAAVHGLAIKRLALYDPPPTAARFGALAQQIAQLIVEGKRGEAVERFQLEAVGMPAEVVARLRHAPFRPGLEQIAHTLVYDLNVLAPFADELLASIKTPTLVLDAENGPPPMHAAARVIATELRHARLHVLTGQTHDIDPGIVAPVLTAFFAQ